MKTRLFFLAVMSLSLASLYAAQLKIAEVGVGTYTCIFSPNCVVPIVDTEPDITTNISSVLLDGFVQSRTFEGQAGTAEAGNHAYEYRVVLNVHSGAKNISITNMTIENIGTILEFPFNGVTNNQVWVVNRGGIGRFGPTSATVSSTNITFYFARPLIFGPNDSQAQSSFFFGLASPIKPPKEPNAWAICAGYATIPNTNPVPINVRLPIRAPILE